MRTRFLVAGAAAVAAAGIWLALAVRGGADPAEAPTTARVEKAPAAPSAPATAPALATPVQATLVDDGSDPARPAWEGEDLPPPPPPPPGGVPRAPRPDKKPMTADEQRAFEVKGVALIDLRIATLGKEIDAATAANDTARVAALRVRLARLEDTRRIRQATLDGAR